MQPQLNIETRKDGSACTLLLDGELDVNSSPLLRQRLISLIDEGFMSLLVDLRKLTFIDSSGLGVLVSALRRVRENGGSMRLLCNCDDDILKVLKIVGLDRAFPIITDSASGRGL